MELAVVQSSLQRILPISYNFVTLGQPVYPHGEEVQHSSQNGHHILQLLHATEFCPDLQCQQGEQEYGNGSQSFLVVLQDQHGEHEGEEVLGGEEVRREDADDDEHVDEAFDEEDSAPHHVGMIGLLQEHLSCSINIGRGTQICIKRQRRRCTIIGSSLGTYISMALQCKLCLFISATLTPLSQNHLQPPPYLLLLLLLASSFGLCYCLVRHYKLLMQQGGGQRQSCSKKCRKIGPYILLRVIGKGSYSTVFEARDASGGRFAVKQISLENLSGKQLERIQQEVAVLSLIKHENIVALLDFKQTARNLYLVFEHCECSDLQAYLSAHCGGTLPQPRVRHVMLKLKAAFRAIRQHRVVHRDLKLSNILVTKDFEIKLADFGFARSHAQDEYFRSVVGTPLTMAPEILDRREYNQKCDIWSLGVVAYQMLFGCSPFFKAEKLTQHEIRESFNRPLEFPKQISQQARDFIARALVKDPVQRMGFEELFAHAWLCEEGESEGSLSELLRGQALRGQLVRSLCGSTKPPGEKEFILGNCQSVLGYCFLQFVKGYVENSLTGWANLARHVLDTRHRNRRLSFLALALLLQNIDHALTAPYSVLVNAARVITLPKYMDLRGLQSWEMSEYSKRLPNFIAKSRANIEEFLASDGQTMAELKTNGEMPLSELFLKELRAEVDRLREEGTSKEGEKEVQKQSGQGEGELRVFLRVRPWGGRHICINVQSPILTKSALELLVRTLSLQVKYDSLCKKCANLFRLAVVNELTALELEMQGLRERMAHSQSIIF